MPNANGTVTYCPTIKSKTEESDRKVHNLWVGINSLRESGILQISNNPLKTPKYLDHT